MRNALARVPAGQRNMVAALLRTIFTQDSKGAAHEQWRKVADSLRPRFAKLAELMDEAEQDVLAHMSFPREHWPQLASTDEIDKPLRGSGGILSEHGRPRDEEHGWRMKAVPRRPIAAPPLRRPCASVGAAATG